MLTTNEAQSARERLTLIRLFKELRGLGYEGGSDAVRRYARARRRARRAASVEAYLALSFTPGEAYQFDWSHEIVGLNGVTTLVKVAHVRLCHSRMPFGDAKRKGLTPSQLLLFLDIDGGLAQWTRQSTGGPTNRDKLYPSIRRPHLTSVPFHVFTEEVQESNL